MKKLITILAIMVVLVGAVFADTTETHTLNITATSEKLAPAFQLGIGSVYSNNTIPTPYNPEAAATVAYTNAQSARSFDFEVGDTVPVVAYLINNAKIFEQYTLTFSGGVFTVTKNNVSATITPEIKIASVGSSITGISSIARTSDTVATVNFNGTRCSASTSNRVTLATVNYKYDPDTEVDPDTYTANIVMTVVSI